MKKVVLFGDNLIAGFDGRALSQEVTHAVKHTLQHMGYEMEIINTGKTGDTTRDALGRLKKDVLSFTPDYVVLFFNKDLLNQMISRHEYIENIDQMIQQIGKEKTILITPSYADPITQGQDHALKDIQTYGNDLLMYAKKKAISIIDIYHHITIYPGPKEFLQQDGFYYSHLGNELLGSLIARNIKQLEEKN